MQDFLNDWGITGAVFLPLIGAVVLMLIPKREEALQKSVALLTSLARQAAATRRIPRAREPPAEGLRRYRDTG